MGTRSELIIKASVSDFDFEKSLTVRLWTVVLKVLVRGKRTKTEN